MKILHPAQPIQTTAIAMLSAARGPLYSRIRSDAPKRFASNNALPSPSFWSSYKSYIIGAALAGTYSVYYMYANNKTKCDIASAVCSTPPLNPKEYTSFKLKEVLPVTHNTNIYRFSFPHVSHKADMPVTSFIMARATPAGSDKPVARPYTPTSSEDAKGHFDLLVKNYPDGVMSSYIASLKPGDSLEVMGPIVKYKYEANMHKEIGLVAGGTGITPMLQIIHKVLRDSNDKTKITLLFGNVAENDILLKDELDSLATKHPNQFRVVHVLSKANAPKKWSGDTGFINQDLIKKYLPAASADNIKLFICGPPPMISSIAGAKAPDYSQGELAGILKKMGYTSEQVFKF